MESIDEQCGFEALFISEVPDYLHCSLCHLVLRNPLLILQCGHKFCEQCFEKYKSCSRNSNSLLCCPVDKDPIDLNNVFPDKGLERVVGNLMVKCTNNEDGCVWEGALTDIVLHQEKCEYKGVKELSDRSSFHEDKTTPLLNEIYQKMCKFEETLFEKEKDMAFLKFNLQEVKSKLDGSLVEVDMLKERNRGMESELEVIKSHNQDLQKLELKVENLLLKNVLLEQKVISLENQILVPRKELSDNMSITAVREGMENLKASLEQYKLKSTQQLKDLHSDIIGELKEVASPLEKSLNELTGQVNCLGSRTAATEGKAKGFDSNKNLIQDLQEGIKDLKSHVKNVENILFHNCSTGSDEVALQWKLQNYRHHFDVGVYVYSPVFYTQLDGYSFRLYVKWTGKKKGNLGVYFWLHRAKDYKEVLKPFNIPYAFEMQDKRGDVRSADVTLADIKKARKGSFSISSGYDNAREGYGCPTFLNTSDVQHYIVNDMISITCRFKPHTK